MAISVLLKGLPNMMRGLISEAIEAEPDMRLMGDIEATVAVLPQSAPDAVVLGSSGVEASLDEVAPILERWPASVVVAIETRAQHSSFYELQPLRVALGEIGTRELVRLIRHKAAAREAESGAATPAPRETPDA
jgi:chemotaxis response regulator CheB